MTLVLLGLLLLGSPGGASVDRACVCATMRATNGWCDVHQFGYVAGLKITSAWLFEALDAHGHAVDTSTYTCPACRRAIAEDGYCEEHRIGFVHKLAYFSRLTYEQAHGELKRPEELRCATCRKNSESHGWCDRDKAGMVGMTMIRDRARYDVTVHALEIVEAANREAKRCDYCAVAMITDTECPYHKIRYKDGKVIDKPKGG